MKFTITIDDATASDLAKLSACFNGSTATVAAPETAVGTFADNAVTTAAIGTVTTAPQPTPAAPASGELDVNGLPWDERIHSSNNGKNADGSWRRKRGVSDELVKQVEDELRGVVKSQPTPDAPAPQPTQQTMIQDFANQVAEQANQPTPDAPAPVATPAPVAAPQPAPAAMPVPPQNIAPQPVATPAPQPTPDTGGAITYPVFMQSIMQKMSNGQIDNAYVMSICQRAGLPAITALASDTAKIAQIVQLMQSEGKW